MSGILRAVAFVLVALSCPLTHASDLRGSLTSLGINASFPGDASYTLASSPFNLRFTFQPAAIAFPKTAQEVSEIVKIGAAQKLRVVARSGGHSYIANGLGGRNGALVIDLRRFDKITIDSVKGTAIIESGNSLGDIASTLAQAGRALPHGTCPYVGIGGHAAYGGFGFTSRMWGLTLDTVNAVNIVLANATVSRITNQNNPDLFWALRGSAGSFGIVTSIEVTTFPAPPSATVFTYTWNLTVADTSKGIAAYQSFVQTDIPPQFGCEVNLFRGPASGTVTFSLTGGWYGPARGLNSTLAPLLRQMPRGPQITLNTGTYLNSVVDLAGGSLDTKSQPDSHDTFYAKSLITPENSPMSNTAIHAFADYLANEGFTSKTDWFVQLELYGGKNSAINAVAPDATAFAHRSSIFTIQFYASSPGKTPPYPQYGFTFLDGMVKTITFNSPSNWNYGAYPNYIDDRLVDWRARYYGAHYGRLMSLKAKYDPHDIFAFPTGIEE
ncbi:putative FAD-linked oxidoreductase YgaK [Hypsizygus marmoreus]|uniref:FAD-linked oxidoreductase YgaK n=1 Tax=Hypsizygus marmoreus TaxID=39966 RepID=A0A369J9Z2_HYPMA|nr:putative FAD-linked oxidoreductase YgaK [Hypsizygus marmoreus]